MRKTTAAMIIGLAFVPTPSLAQSADKVSEAYQAGKVMGLSPQTGSEYAMCAAYWDRWSKSAANDWEQFFVDGLDPALKPTTAEKTSAYWAKKADQDFKNDTAYAAHSRSEAAEKAEEAYDYLMLSFGDKQMKLFKTLGTCAK